MSPARTVLHVSPHPDDEILGAGATLLGLRDHGWRVVNLACSLGRPADEERRRGELAAALQILGYESAVAEPPVALGGDADHRAAEDRVAGLVSEVAARVGAELVVSPGPEDAHHAHATVGRAVARAAAPPHGPGDQEKPARRWWAWSLWRDLEQPTLYVPWGAGRLDQLTRALDAHAGELARTPYRDVLAARGRLQAVLGAERVFGFGTGAASAEPYADLLTERTWDGGAWQVGPARLLDPA